MAPTRSIPQNVPSPIRIVPTGQSPSSYREVAPEIDAPIAVTKAVVVATGRAWSSMPPATASANSTTTTPTTCQASYGPCSEPSDPSVFRVSQARNPTYAPVVTITVAAI